MNKQKNTDQFKNFETARISNLVAIKGGTKPRRIETGISVRRVENVG